MLNTPILLITFNRPNHTRKVLERILEANPCDLYVFQDGAREGNEADVVKCQQVRDVINELVTKHQTPDTTHQTPFTLHTNYSSINLGCGRGPVAGMDWFFDNVEYGIILEDDIDPHPLFWNFMEDLLVRYKEDNRVGMVCGHNLQRRYCGYQSYYFTYAMEGTLGWGTWRRVWKDFAWDIPFDNNKLSKSYIHNYGFPNKLVEKECAFYKKWLSRDRHDSWDFQWDYYLLEHGYLNVRANSCLTSHEGDDSDATHSGYTNPNYKMSVNVSLFTELKHPKKVTIHLKEYLRVYWRTLKYILSSKKI